ncbi:MAG: glycosyltransferase family 2 protein [Vicinamibacteria bacterium]
MNPLVTIAILNYQRKETLRRAIEQALAQDYSPLEVLVVDNASTDGSDSMVEKEFPSVRLVRLPQNVGCAARNVGVESAKGEIVLTIDNDVLLEGTFNIPLIVRAFEERPGTACLNFKILRPDGALSNRDWCHPRDWRLFANQTFETDYVLEGASAFRRESFLAVGGYWPRLFIGHEGWDLALRLVDAGHEIFYFPEISVTHLASNDARPGNRIYYSFTRNAIWVAVRNHRFWSSLASLTRDLALMGFSSIRAGQLGSYLRGIADGVKGVGEAYSARAPLRKQTYEHLASVRALQPSWLEKARRHIRERPI